MMLSFTTLDDLVREQERLRLQSLRHLEELRIRQDKYRSCLLSGHCLPSKANVSQQQQNVSHGAGTANTTSEHIVCCSERKMRVDDIDPHYRPASTVVRSSSSQGFDSLLNSSNASTVAQLSQSPSDVQKRINVNHSISAVLSDDLHSEKWPAFATQAARKKLISGRTFTERNFNNSPVGTHNGSKVFEPVSMSSKFTDSHGSKAHDLDTADYFASGDATSGNQNCNGTPQKSEQSLEGTPKSILRHRQIIDRNVRVESKFDHTPTTNARSRRHRRGLNFSYSDVDEAQLFGRKLKSVNFDVDSKKSKACSQSQAVDLTSQPSEAHDETQIKGLMSSSLAGDTLPSSTQSYYYAPNATDSAENSVDTRGSSAARTTAPEGLLLHAGNDRQNAQIVRELESRSKSYLFSSDHPSVSNASTDASRSQVLNAFFLVFHLRWCF